MNGEVGLKCGSNWCHVCLTKPPITVSAAHLCTRPKNNGVDPSTYNICPSSSWASAPPVPNDDRAILDQGRVSNCGKLVGHAQVQNGDAVLNIKYLSSEIDFLVSVTIQPTQDEVGKGW